MTAVLCGKSEETREGFKIVIRLFSTYLLNSLELKGLSTKRTEDAPR